MAAPAYVPRKAIDDTRIYTSPPRRPGPWLPGPPGRAARTASPRGERLGSPGPDQGFALTLAERFRGQLALRPGEHEDDAIAGCLAVALKRASLFGRAPVIHDLTIAFTLWGFLDEQAARRAGGRCAARCSRRWPTRTTTSSSGRSPTWCPSRPCACRPPRSPGATATDWRSLLDLPD